MKLKNFLLQRIPIIRAEWSATEWEEIFTNYISNGGVISNINMKRALKSGHQGNK